MKMKREHYDLIKNRINQVLEKHNTTLDKLKDAYRLGGMSMKRFRWDLFLATKIRIGDGIGMKGDIDLYQYLDDSHIDTALRKITKTN
jgi:hypothetical protein